MSMLFIAITLLLCVVVSWKNEVELNAFTPGQLA